MNITTNLAGRVEVFVHTDFDLVKQDGVEGGVQLMAHQFLHILLDLCPESFILEHQQFQQVAQESGDNEKLLYSRERKDYKLFQSHKLLLCLNQRNQTPKYYMF